MQPAAAIAKRSKNAIEVVDSYFADPEADARKIAHVPSNQSAASRTGNRTAICCIRLAHPSTASEGENHAAEHHELARVAGV